MTFANERLPTIAAGVIGGILTVAMLPKITFRVFVLAILGGGACAAYMTPLVVEYLGLQSRNLEYSIAFLLGISGMHIVAGVLNVGKRFRDDPAAVIAKFRDGGK